MLQVQELAKRHGDEAVFSHVNLVVPAGEFVAIVGESGVGKSTLLNCLAGLDAPSGGSVRVRETDLTQLGEAAQAHFRRRHLGFVFQAFHVLPHLTVAQNVALPLMLLGAPAAEQAQRVAEELDAVGLSGLGERLPQQLSGGQLQRVALARALVHRPALILADEPTGNLDPVTAERIMRLLAGQAREHGAACVMVTHSQAAAAHADRVLRLTAQGLQDAG
ncbi:MAG: ABC transporter ATP-binding protein [Burkholderiales bacterium]|nr:ABC transporter ATP-binding protein [Burkholderiales bacterium]